MGETNRCFEYLVRDPLEKASNDVSQAPSTATYVIVGALGVVALLAAYAVLHELCEHSSDPNCKSSLPK